MARIRRYTWFIEPLNPETNEVVSADLPAENAYKGITCAGGIERNLWVCDYPYVSRLERSIASFPFLDFRVYKREGQGSIRLWLFNNRRRTRIKRQLAKKSLCAKQLLSKIAR